MRWAFLILLSSVFISGCQLPQWRVFQKKVPQPIVKPASVVELERQSADFIARNLLEPPELKPVAVKLSQSLGAPKEPILDTPVEAESQFEKAWNKELLKTQAQIAELNKELQELNGKKVEDTGLNVFGPSMGLLVIGGIALLVAFPPLATILWWLMQRASGALTRTARGISNYVKENPNEGERLKNYLKQTQDTVDREVIAKIRARL